MTAIAAVAAPTMPAPVSPPAARAATAPVVPMPRADQPAVINDVASQAASEVGVVNDDDLPTTLRGRVSRVLEDIGSHNSFNFIDKHSAWDALEAKFGKARMDESKQIHARFNAYNASQVTQGVADLQGQAGVSGLSVTRKEDGNFAVSEFSFTDTGSTYTIKQGTDGRMIGLKDGQGWKTWQVDRPTAGTWSRTGAETALATLTAQPAGNAGKVPTNLLA